MPPPGPTPPPAARRGCLKNALIGCGAVALLVLIGMIGSIIYMRRNPQAMTDLMMRQIESNYASDVTEQEKTDLRAAYAEFRRALVNGSASRRWLQDMRTTLLSGGPSTPVTREQVRTLTETFRAGAGNPSPAARPPATPAALRSTTPTP